ncbi:prolipoprotein diacylglyceryl transferase [Arthrobacter crystallopoietes BAB-32]|uniref:Phosphatidylglycerol--prolipoprotein diacylglyceryl transferase n=1 Tax=Arthrobacter crystallopoietes BAB-32 TaxID=1246476 RepID=N1UZP9_9MICC|nr:prolipoprotein diacylglyceryl transferase [Arthrobacter crystallopoietes]EMY35871.1 prolipoprotein diacylglyceryl transferase [Arthrobacter crystallopoietes BAB-32]
MHTTTSALVIPASIPSPDWSGFTIGPLTIHAYALCILAGIVAALWLTNRRWHARGGPEGTVWDIAIWAIPFGIIGGRLYHVFSSPDAYFGPDGDLSLIPQIWLGGLGIWGAVALGLVGAWIGCRRAGVKLTAFMDAAAPGVLLAQAIGRWGNWFNQELFGAPTDLPWGLEIDADNPNFPAGAEPGTLFHPTFLYESLWNLAGVALLLLLDRRFRFRRGMLFWLYVAYYTLGRVWIEMMRIDDAEMITLFGITQRLNVWTSLLLLAAALVMFAVLARRPRTPESDSVYLSGREPVAAADNAGTADEVSATDKSENAGSKADVASGGKNRVNGAEMQTKKTEKNVSAASRRASLSDTANEPEGSTASGAGGKAGPEDAEDK